MFLAELLKNLDGVAKEGDLVFADPTRKAKSGDFVFVNTSKGKKIVKWEPGCAYYATVAKIYKHKADHDLWAVLVNLSNSIGFGEIKKEKLREAIELLCTEGSDIDDLDSKYFRALTY